MTTTTPEPLETHRVTSDPSDPIGDDGSPFAGCLPTGSIIVQAILVLALTIWFLIETIRRIL